MEFSKAEKGLLIAVATVAVISIGVPVFGGDYANQLLQEESDLNGRLQNELQQLDQNLATIEDRRNVLRANQENYLQLVERGVVGAQDPVPWVNLMRSINARRRLNPIEYNFLDEVDHDPDISKLTEGSSVNIASWEMSLQLPMLHDMDMFMFLNDLDAGTESLMFPVECSLFRVERDFELISRVNINSECRVTWVFVKDPQISISGGGG